MNDQLEGARGREEPIVVETIDKAWAVVTLNRPAKRNCVSLAMWQALEKIFRDLSMRPDIRAVALAGSGGHFSSGADISEFATVRNSPKAAAEYEAAAEATLLSIVNCTKPTIASIAGACVGGGCSLALACDLRVADATARIGIPAGRLGIIYGALESQLLLSAVGLGRAKRILYTAELFTAEDLLQLGLVDVLAPNDLGTTLRGLVRQIADNAPLSLAGAKFILNALARGELAQHSHAVQELVEGAADSEDYREGSRAFLERRPPVFRGR